MSLGTSLLWRPLLFSPPFSLQGLLFFHPPSPFAGFRCYSYVTSPRSYLYISPCCEVTSELAITSPHLCQHWSTCQLSTLTLASILSEVRLSSRPIHPSKALIWWLLLGLQPSPCLPQWSSYSSSPRAVLSFLASLLTISAFFPPV